MPKFKVGDIVKVVRGDSLKWVDSREPLRVIMSPWNDYEEFIQVNRLDGSNPAVDNYLNHVRADDCIDYNFMHLAKEAIKRAKV